ncbi:MAG: glycosyltransferase [Acidobacteriota bacterium]
MKILMIAPEPFFQPRGTPLSEYFRIKALIDLGHLIDLVTYPVGDDVDFENLKIIRISKVPFIKEIKIGPSFQKIPLDLLIFLKTFSLLLKKKYDIIFSHEEGSFIGVFFSKIFRIPHLYDMHSSLPQQLRNFKFTNSVLIYKIFVALERWVLKNSKSVIVICKDLENRVKEIVEKEKIFLIENFLDFTPEDLPEEKAEKIRGELNLKNKKIILYAGTFEPYQGLHLLIGSLKKIEEKDEKVYRDLILVLIGGKDSQIKELKNYARKAGVEDKVIFLGEKKPDEIPFFIKISDCLLSPRISGTNTPLKIYSYLKSGKPVVATNLWTHTQVINDDIAILVDPDPDSVSDGILKALNTEIGPLVGKKAKEYALLHFTYTNYLKMLRSSLFII